MLKPDAAFSGGTAPQTSSHAGVRFRMDVAFTDAEGKQKDSLQKRTEYALQQLQEPLSKILQADEVVLYVSPALSPVSLIQQFSTGWYIYKICACILVFTNRRLLHFRTNPGLVRAETGWTWRRSWRALAWGDVRTAKASGLLSGMLDIAFQNGKKERFWGIQRGDKKKMQALLEALVPQSAGETTPAGSFVSLCPKCATGLAAGQYQCAACGQLFKDERTARMRSILIPGGGYFYTGMTFLGIADAFVESALALMLLILILEASGSLATAEPGEPAGTWGTVIFVVIILALEKAVTIYHANHRIKEFLPAD